MVGTNGEEVEVVVNEVDEVEEGGVEDIAG